MFDFWLTENNTVRPLCTMLFCPLTTGRSSHPQSRNFWLNITGEATADCFLWLSLDFWFHLIVCSLRHVDPSLPFSYLPLFLPKSSVKLQFVKVLFSISTKFRLCSCSQRVPISLWNQSEVKHFMENPLKLCIFILHTVPVRLKLFSFCDFH